MRDVIKIRISLPFILLNTKGKGEAGWNANCNLLGPQMSSEVWVIT